MESSNCENEDPQISEEQKQILERLKCLNNGENTIHQSAVRLNFGLKVIKSNVRYINFTDMMQLYSNI